MEHKLNKNYISNKDKKFFKMFIKIKYIIYSLSIILNYIVFGNSINENNKRKWKF
jgi:hypothetical protein